MITLCEMRIGVVMRVDDNEGDSSEAWCAEEAMLTELYALRNWARVLAFFPWMLSLYKTA